MRDLSAARGVASAQRGLLFASQLSSVGLTSANARDFCRRGTWRRVCRGAYDLWPSTELSPADAHTRLVHAAAANLPPDVAVAAESAGLVFGFAGLPRWDGTVHFASERSITGPAPGVVLVHQWQFANSDVVCVDGLRVLSPQRTVVDLVLRLGRDNAVSVLDHVLNAGTLSVENLALVELACAGRPGAVRARGCLELADGRAESPLESRARLRCIDGGVPPDELQWPVYDSEGWLLGLGDFAWLRAGRRPLVGEADGKDVHGAPEALYKDRSRANNFVIGGVDIIRFTWEDTLARDRIPRLVRAALAAS